MNFWRAGGLYKRAVRRSAYQGGPTGCTLNVGLPFSAALRSVLLCNLLDDENSFFYMEIPPSRSSALRLVLSGRNSVGINFTAQLTVGGRLCVALEQESTTFTKVFADAFHIKSFHQIFVQSPLPRLAEAACLFSLWQQLL